MANNENKLKVGPVLLLGGAAAVAWSLGQGEGPPTEGRSSRGRRDPMPDAKGWQRVGGVRYWRSEEGPIFQITRGGRGTGWNVRMWRMWKKGKAGLALRRRGMEIGTFSTLNEAIDEARQYYYATTPGWGHTARGRRAGTLKRGDHITIQDSAVPPSALSNEALVIFANLSDKKVGRFHKVMFNAGSKGVVFKTVLDSEVARSSARGRRAPRGKAQQAIMASIKNWPVGYTEELTEVMQHPSFRGIHFGKARSAAQALARQGLLGWDGSTITKTAPRGARARRARR